MDNWKGPFVDKPEGIVLTDYPKYKNIEANYRGVGSQKLLDLRKSLFHGMMAATSEEAGGYCITYHYKGIEEELIWRKVPMEKL